MKFEEALQFIKVTIEQVAIASIRSLKKNIFFVELKSNKVQVTNPTKLPNIIKVQETKPIDNKKDIELQTKELSKLWNDKFKELSNLLKTLSPLSELKISNLKDIPKSSENVRVLNPIKLISIANFYELQKEIGKLQKAIESLKLNPKITVPEIKIPEIIIPTLKAEVILDRRETLISDNPEKSVPVRLTDGKKFYTAIEDIKVGLGRNSAYSDSKGVKQQALVDADRHVQVDVLTSQLPTGAATSDNQTNGTAQTKIKETSPTSTTKVNPSYVLIRNGSGYIIGIAMTIGTTTYNKTITRDGSNLITNIGVWI